MLKHIDSLTTQKWFHQPWVLLGTGASLNRFNYDNWKNYNIAAIYDAVFACDRVRVTFASDHWAGNMHHFSYFMRSDYVATRIINSDIPPFKNVRYWEYDCDVEQLGGRRLFPENRTYPCSNTSSFIIYWLGVHGIKTVYTSGIDGGWGIADVVSSQYREQATAERGWHPDRENEGVYGHAEQYGMKLIKI
jgi:hypothetical protein